MTTAEFRCIPAGTVQRARKAAGEYSTGGTWVAGAETVTDVEGVVHPVTAKSRLSERMIREISGNRTRKWVVVYSAPGTWQTEVEEIGQQADIMIYAGSRYEIMMVDDWEAGVLDHQKAIAAKLDVRDGD